MMGEKYVESTNVEKVKIPLYKRGLKLLLFNG
jgi:hypothetical protein